MAAIDIDLDLTTDNVLEGSNLYYTQARFDAAFSAKSTTNLSEGINLYYSQARFDAAFSAKSTSDLVEGSNLYYTNARADARIVLQKGAANGIAPLGADSKIPNAYLPALAITDTFVVNSQAAMLALGSSGAETGDVAVRSDVNETYILQGTNPAVLSNWVKLLTPTDSVLSVNGMTGAVALTTTNIAEGTNLYYTDARARAAITGTPNRITVTSGVVDIASTYIGQTSITTLGTVTTGTLGGGIKVLLGSDATGDIYYNGGSGNLTRLAAGASGTFLMYNGVGAAPIVSTLVLPNSSVNKQVLYTTATNTIGSSSNFNFDTATGQLLIGTATAFGTAKGIGILGDVNTSTFIRADVTGTTGQATLFCQNQTNSTVIQFDVFGSAFPGTIGGISRANMASLRLSPASGGVAIITAEGAFPLVLATNSTERMRISATGNIYLGAGTNPTASLHIRAGSATASTAPIKFTAGTNLTAAEAGALEWDGTNLFVTQTTGPTRKTIAYTSDLTGFITSVSGTINRITSTGGTAPVIDISASYIGQASITTLGTITTGTWTGTTIAVANGGTGQTTYTNGQLLIGNTTDNALTKATLTAPAAGISITNGTGTITFALTNDLSALEGLSSTGIAVRSATDTWVQRTISGTANEITVTNGDGVSANPVISLPTSLTFTGKTVTGGTFTTPTININDDVFSIRDNGDITKILQFQLSGITTSTTRILTIPNASGVIALTSDLTGFVTSVSGTTNRITSTGGTAPVIDISATFEALLGKIANPLSQFASTTSAQLLGVMSDETGAGALVFGTSPTFTTSIGVGIAATTTDGINGSFTYSAASATLRNGLNLVVDHTASSLAASICGATITVNNSASGSATPTIKGIDLIVNGNSGTNIGSGLFTGLNIAMNTTAAQTGTIVNISGINFQSPTFAGTKPTSNFAFNANNQGVAGITTSIVLRIAAQSGSTNNYAIASAAGNFHGFGKLTGITETVDISGTFKVSGNISFFGVAMASQQASGANLTNNVTVGGSNDVIADFASLAVYATDAATIRNNIYQLARKLKQVNDALRLYGLLT